MFIPNTQDRVISYLLSFIICSWEKRHFHFYESITQIPQKIEAVDLDMKHNIVRSFSEK